MKEWKVIFATLVIFGTGVVTGGLLVHLTSQKPTRVRPLPNQVGVLPTLRDAGKDLRNPILDQRKEYLGRLTRELNLTPAQLEQVEKILKESQQRTKAVWDSVQPRMQDEVRKTREQIHGALDETQRKRFDELNAPIPVAKEKRFEKSKATGTNRAAKEVSLTNSQGTLKPNPGQ